MENSAKSKVKIVNITPSMAKGFLSNRYEGQRNLRTAHVDRLAAEMKNGKWHLSNDAITFVRGKLANGQHRCEAIVKSGVTVACPVLETEDKELFDYMDSGLNRTMDDNLNQHGFKYAAIISATARWVLSYENGMFGWGSANSRTKENKGVVIARSNLLDYCRNNKTTLEKLAATVFNLYNEYRILYPSHACAFLMIASKKYPKEAMQFITSVYDGSSQDAAFDFRERVIKNSMAKAKLSRFYVFGLLIKAFNAYLKGERIGSLKASAKEEFPSIV